MATKPGLPPGALASAAAVAPGDGAVPEPPSA